MAVARAAVKATQRAPRRLGELKSLDWKWGLCRNPIVESQWHTVGPSNNFLCIFLDKLLRPMCRRYIKYKLVTNYPYT